MQNALYLAGTGDSWQAVAVSQSKLDFDINALGTGPWDPVCPQPVVLTGLQNITHLVRPDGDVLLIHNAHFLPLQTHTDTQFCYSTGEMKVLHFLGIKEIVYNYSSLS